MVCAGEPRSERTVVVVTGGDRPGREVVDGLPADVPVIAADSGGDSALALGLVVGEAVGDFDSLSQATYDTLVESGTAFERHEPDKDATDMALALTAALRHHPDRIVVLGGLGGRVDHELANVLALVADPLAAVDVVLRSGRQTISTVRPGRPTTITGPVGDLVSLVAVSGSVRGVMTQGLRWPLSEAELSTGSTLGVSNELVDPPASVTCTDGVLLAVQPGMAAANVAPRPSTATSKSGGPR